MSCKEDGMCKTAAICFLAGCQDEASPVQGAASAISRSTAAEGQWMGDAATSSASGAKGAAEQLDTLADRLRDALPACIEDSPDNSRDLWGIYYDLRAALADRSPAVLPVAGKAVPDEVPYAVWQERVECARIADAFANEEGPGERRYSGNVISSRILARTKTRVATPAPEQEAAQADSFAQKVDADTYRWTLKLAQERGFESVAAAVRAAPVAPPGAQEAVGRAALTEFIDKVCLNKPELVACAESAFYWFNKCLAAPVPATTPAEQPEGLEPVTGDVLPAIGSKVFIHLARQDEWIEHTVVGYYAWRDLGGVEFLHRVFVRVVDASGYENARMLHECRATATNTNQPENLGAANTNKGGEA